ncbi:MAG: DUF1992 domain-containing protein [Thermodesulfobacteriota bacterium]|nr:MAG: DUF1992 domain-containing protein [Thermodesulfobacteriota bacterium]
MEFFEWLAEERIREAMERGDFADLPGAGRPLSLEDDSGVDPEQRLAFKILKNAGCLPPELELKKDIHRLIDFIATVEDDAEALELKREVDFKIMRFNMAMKRPLHLDAFPEYADAVLKRLSPKKR